MVEFGLDTFGDTTRSADGQPVPHGQVIRDVIEEGVTADRLGLDFFGVGEHHRADFAVSSPEMVLAAIASRTERVRLGSAVTVLSSDEPVRVFERFSTLHAVSQGRAEIIVGRGSFTESFPLFGLKLDDYDSLFEEKLELLVALLRQETVSWSGSVRAPLQGVAVFPRLERTLTTWVGVGGSPQSIVRAAFYELPVMLAIIGGDPVRFQPYVELMAKAAGEIKKPLQKLGVHSPGHVARTDEEAAERFWPCYKAMHDRIGTERGWPPMQRQDFQREIDAGSLYVGSAETVARKIARAITLLHPARFQLKYSAGELGHGALMDAIERFAGEVVPRVRALLDAAGAAGQPYKNTAAAEAAPTV